MASNKDQIIQHQVGLIIEIFHLTYKALVIYLGSTQVAVTLLQTVQQNYLHCYSFKSMCHTACLLASERVCSLCFTFSDHL